MSKRLALGLLLLAVLVIMAAYASAFLPGEPPGWAAWALAAGTCVSLVAMMALGAARGDRVGRRLTTAFALVALVVGAGFAALLLLPATDPADPELWLGLPPRAAVLLYGVGILPFFIVPVAYARTFDALTLSEADLERVREAGRAAADGGRAAAGGDTGGSDPSGAAERPGGEGGAS